MIITFSSAERFQNKHQVYGLGCAERWLYKYKQAGAELGQAQVKLDDIVVVVVEVVVTAMVEVEFQLLFRVSSRIKQN